MSDLNGRPTDYESAALTAELMSEKYYFLKSLIQILKISNC